MDEMLGSSNELLWDAPEMHLSIGGEAKLLTTEEANTLLSKLREVPPPLQGSELIKEYETFEQLLQILGLANNGRLTASHRLEP
jgi:hypothetical protein